MRTLSEPTLPAAMKPERWLVLSPDATNSGAPRMLLRVLQGVQAARGPQWSCEILLRRGGSLRSAFEQLGPVHVLAHPASEGSSLRAGLVRKFFDRPWAQPRNLKRVMQRWPRGHFDLVYNNTATNSDLVPAARDLGSPVLTHVHELASFLGQFLTRDELAQTLLNTDRFIAVSPAAASDLVSNGVAADRVTVVPNFLPALPPGLTAADQGMRRRELGLPVEAAIVVGCGHLHAIKGTDFFVAMAAELAVRSSRPLCCVWLGGETDRRFARSMREDVQRRGLGTVLRFVGQVVDSAPWLAASDVVAVTSRVESFSLVALEAAAQGRPVVGFSGARGLDVILRDTPELLVQEFDGAGMAVVVQRLLEAPARAQQMGERLRAKVGETFLAAPRIADILRVVDALEKERTR